MIYLVYLLFLSDILFITLPPIHTLDHYQSEIERLKRDVDLFRDMSHDQSHDQSLEQLDVVGQEVNAVPHFSAGLRDTQESLPDIEELTLHLQVCCRDCNKTLHNIFLRGGMGKGRGRTINN